VVGRAPSVYIRSVTGSNPVHDLSKLRIDRDPPPEVRRAFGRTLAVIIILGLLIAGGLFWLRSRSAASVQTVVATPISSGGGGGASAAGATSATANGYVVARIRASVSAKIPGRLASLTVDGGSDVRKGQVIARLENADYAAAVGEAEANLASARAQVAEAVADRDQSAREARRVAQIHGQSPELVSVQEVEAAQARADQAAARAGSADARVGAAAAALRYAQATLENTYIRAPFTGTVLRKEAEVGEVVAPSVGGGLTRGAVVTMADLSSLEVEVDVNEAYIARVDHGQRAKITLDAYPDTTFRGEVRQVVPTADRQRATVQVKVSILDRDPRILPEMGARVDFQASASGRGGDSSGASATGGPPRFRLPATAVREAGGRSVVWLVRDGRLQAREVQAGPVSGEYREITRGLSGGEVVVTGGVENPKEGMRVKTD
jgi:RND family efflux transporter MFP subunit